VTPAGPAEEVKNLDAAGKLVEERSKTGREGGARRASSRLQRETSQLGREGSRKTRKFSEATRLKKAQS